MRTYEEKTDILKALAHPTRMEIVFRLKEDGCNVSEIQANLGLPQSTISQHLKVLKSVGIISSRREGTKVCYTVKIKEMLQVIELL